jgi:hypothetical protein
VALAADLLGMVVVAAVPAVIFLCSPVVLAAVVQVVIPVMAAMVTAAMDLGARVVAVASVIPIRAAVAAVAVSAPWGKGRVG